VSEVDVDVNCYEYANASFHLVSTAMSFYEVHAVPETSHLRFVHTREPIMIVFGVHVSEKVSNQKIALFSHIT